MKWLCYGITISDQIAEHDYVYVKDCLWDIAGEGGLRTAKIFKISFVDSLGCGFAYGHKEGCLEEGWMPTRCLVNVEMVSRTLRWSSRFTAWGS